MEKRLFIGIKIEPSRELINLLSKLKDSLKDSDIKWVEIANLHLTLMFLGNVIVDKIPQIINKLQFVSKTFKIFQVQLLGLGKFEKNRKSNVIWTGIKDDGSLSNIANAVIEAMVELGFEAEKRKFKPHLTLGRVKSYCDESILENYIKSKNNQIIQTSTIIEMVLFESVLKPQGSVYLALSQHQFAK